MGDAALSVEFGDAISPELNARVVALDLALAAAELDGIVETAPSYRSLLICYEPLEISFAQPGCGPARVADRATARSGRGKR